tara:strand:+ start:201 stop:461 length:261 start_codon:yes stop_codon:yes gene_type:complete
MDSKRKIEEVDMSKIIQIDEIVSPIKKLRLCIDEDYDYIKMLENKMNKYEIIMNTQKQQIKHYNNIISKLTKNKINNDNDKYNLYT